MEANVTSTNSSRRYLHVIYLESWDKSARSELYYTSISIWDGEEMIVNII